MEQNTLTKTVATIFSLMNASEQNDILSGLISLKELLQLIRETEWTMSVSTDLHHFTFWGNIKEFYSSVTLYIRDVDQDRIPEYWIAVRIFDKITESSATQYRTAQEIFDSLYIPYAVRNPQRKETHIKAMAA